MNANMDTEGLVKMLGGMPGGKKKHSRDEFIFLNQEFLLVTAELMRKDSHQNLVYLHDLAKKGYYELLARKINSAGGFFTRMEKLIGQSDVFNGQSDPFNDCICCLFLSHYYTVGKIDHVLADRHAGRSAEAGEVLYGRYGGPFFFLLKNFSMAYQAKIGLRSGEEASVETYFEVWRGLICARKENVGGPGLDRLIFRTFGDLYGLSVLSPSFGRIFRAKMPQLLAANAGPDALVTGADQLATRPDALVSFARIRQYMEEDRYPDAFREFNVMLALHQQNEEFVILAASFTEINSRLKEKKDPLQPALASAARNFFSGGIPGYLLDRCIA